MLKSIDAGIGGAQPPGVVSARRDMRPAYTVAAIAIGWLAAAALVAGLVLQGRASTLQRAYQSSSALALVLEEHSARTFQSVDITLAAVGDVLRLAPGLPKNDPVFQTALTERLESIPAVRAIYVIGPDGFIVHDTDYPKTPNVSLADRPYFKALHDNPSLAGSMSKPLLSRSGLGWFVAMSRRVGQGDNQSVNQGATQGGVVVAAVKLDYFETLYRRMGLSEGAVIMLFHRDGTLLARHPGDQDSIGKSFADSSNFPNWLPRTSSGAYITDTGMFDYERLVSYRTVQGTPLMVAISESTDGLLAQWRRSAVGAAIAMAALTVLVTILFIVLLRQRKVRERNRERRAHAEKFAALGQLTSGIAHDFANLLHIVSLNLQIISKQSVEEGRRQDALAVAQRALARGSGLISQLLAFSRRQPLQLRQADLNSLVVAAKALLQQAAGGQVELETDLAPDLAPCLLDETQFEVALVNLVVNAKDAMSGQGRIVFQTRDCADDELPAELRGQRPTGFVRLTVEDNGPGMSEELCRRALEPYFSTKGKGGTGLGLPQVFGFTQQIGGAAQINSTVGVGTTVTLFYPKATAAEASGLGAIPESLSWNGVVVTEGNPAGQGTHKRPEL